MDTFEEKRSLVLEMIAFSAVDGRLHKREYEFLALVANELGFIWMFLMIYFIRNFRNFL